MPKSYARLNVLSIVKAHPRGRPLDRKPGTEMERTLVKKNPKATSEHRAFYLSAVISSLVACLSSAPIYAEESPSKEAGAGNNNSQKIATQEIVEQVIENGASSDLSANISPYTDELMQRSRNAAYNWIPTAELPAALQAQVPPGCQGLYIDPLANQAALGDAGDEMDSQPLVAETGDVEVSNQTKIVLQGNVKVSQGNRSISADKMSYDRESDRAKLEGDVTISRPGSNIQGQYAEISTTKNQANFEDATFILHDTHMRGYAKSIKRTSASKIVLENGALTSCEPGSNAWLLEGQEIVLDRETKQGKGKNIRLKIGSVPVFYLPYISFPIGNERQTGFLAPSFGNSEDGGIDLSIPYYWNIAPNYDATITPRFISGRGTMVETEARYLNRWMSSEAGFAFLPNDDGSRDQDLDRLIENGDISEQEARPNKGNNRWLAQIQQRSGSTSGLYSDIDFTRVSDFDYFRDLGTSSLSVASETYLTQRLEVGYQFDHWRLSYLAQNQQVLLLDLDSPYRKLPQINIDANYRLGPIDIDIDNEYTHFIHRDSVRLNGSRILTGKRFASDYRLRWKNQSEWGFFTPEIGYKTLNYDLKENSLTDLQETEISLGTGQASLDVGLVFEHPTGNFLQTLEPRIFYLYREQEDHSELFGLGAGQQSVNFDTSPRTFSYDQLYRDSRFIGNDRLDDANQVTLGLTSRWFNNDSGEELLSVSVGQIFHFDDRTVSLEGQVPDTSDSSEFAADIHINFSSNTELYANTVYDTGTEQITRGSAGISYAGPNNSYLYNLSYSYLRLNPDVAASEEIDQVDSSFVIPIKPQWTVMARTNYDFENKQELESFIGLEYNDCCYRLRFLARRWLDSNIANLVDDEDAQYDQGLFFEIHFKGLSGRGDKVTSILSDGIPGYKKRETLLH